MTERIPLFPLGTVLFPGLVLPLHVFEERYRALVADRRESGIFGIVAIKHGVEVGPATAVDLHEVGCTTEIRQLNEHPDGRYDLVTVGRRRFRIVTVHTDVAPYLVADVDWLPDTPDDKTDDEKIEEMLVPGVLSAFQRYLELIRTDGQQAGEQLPDDPTVLSYLVAATAVLTVGGSAATAGVRVDARPAGRRASPTGPRDRAVAARPRAAGAALATRPRRCRAQRTDPARTERRRRRDRLRCGVPARGLAGRRWTPSDGLTEKPTITMYVSNAATAR